MEEISATKNVLIIVYNILSIQNEFSLKFKFYKCNIVHFLIKMMFMILELGGHKQ